MVRLAIIRLFPSELDLNTYNIQEIGLAKGLTQQGISTDIYTCIKGFRTTKIIFQQNDTTIRIIPLNGISFLNKIAFYHGLSSKIINGKYDIVQFNDDSQIMTPWLVKICHTHKIKTVLYQGMYQKYTGINKLYQIGFDFLFKKITQQNCDIILAKTEMAKLYLENENYKKIEILPVGLDFNKELRTCSNKDIIQEFKSKYDKILLYVGKIEKRRNPFFLIEILSNLRNKYSMNVGMFVIGDGPLKKSMIEYAEEKGIISHISLINSIPNNEIHEVYNNSDLLLLPTNNEIYGMVIMEALLNEIPVIATPEAGPRSILTDDKLGTCLPLNIENWTDKILEYLNNWNSKEDRIYRNRIVKDRYNWYTIAKKYNKYISTNENSSNQSVSL